MIDRIENRELFTLELEGAVLQGTYHVPARQPAGANATGIVFLAGFPMPRAAHGDAAVRWASSLAEAGYPCFRVDLPGVGDARGDVPAELLGFTNAGGYERVTVSLLKQLVQRYRLAGVVILGQCAGAITAIFTAAVAPECRGLILLDPPFHLPPANRPKVKRALFYWATGSRIGGVLISLNDKLKSIRLRLRRNAPPENANFPLLKRWKTLTAAGLPVLLLNAPEPKATATKVREGRFDYLAYILKLAGSRGKVELRIVEGANHTFSNPVGKAAIRQHVSQWMATAFPFEDSGQGASDTLSTPASAEAECAGHSRMLVGVDATMRG